MLERWTGTAGDGGFVGGISGVKVEDRSNGKEDSGSGVGEADEKFSSAHSLIFSRRTRNCSMRSSVRTSG
jgi:hypothetical protein